MPTSNGQTGRYDIRRGAIYEAHLTDDAVTTDIIKDLSVTVDKDADYFYAATGFDTEQNATLDTTWRTHVSIDIDVPAWATFASVTASFRLQVSGSGGSSLVGSQISFNDPDEPSYGSFASMVSGETREMFRIEVADFSSPGSTITVYGWAFIYSGTSPQNANTWRLTTTSLYAR